MDTHLKDVDIVQRQPDKNRHQIAYNFKQLENLVKSNDYTGITLYEPSSKDKNVDLEGLSEAFASNNTLESLTFSDVKMDVDLVKPLGAGIKADNVTCLVFRDYKNQDSKMQKPLEKVSQELKKKPAAFELKLIECLSYIVKPVIEASYSKCSSFMMQNMDCLQLERPLRRLFSRASLVSITLSNTKEMKENQFLQLARCSSLKPNLEVLNLNLTEVPEAALKCLQQSLNMNMNSGRDRLWKKLNLGNTIINAKLGFAFFRILRSDLISAFIFKLKFANSEAVVRNLSSHIARTRKLKLLERGIEISSRTKFESFKLPLNLHEKANSFKTE